MSDFEKLVIVLKNMFFVSLSLRLHTKFKVFLCSFKTIFLNNLERKPNQFKSKTVEINRSVQL